MVHEGLVLKDLAPVVGVVPVVVVPVVVAPVFGVVSVVGGSGRLPLPFPAEPRLSEEG